jgi:hypothetical protein
LKRVKWLVWATSMAFFTIQMYIIGNFFLFCILVHVYKCHVSIHIIFLFNSNTRHSFYVWPWLYVFLAMFGATCKVGQLVFNTYLVLLVHTWTMIVGRKIWDHFYWFLLSFSFLDPKVNNKDNTPKCPLRNQNDILDDQILLN